MKRTHRNVLQAALIIAMSSTDIMAMAEKYPLEIHAAIKNKVAEIKITGTLYGWGDLESTMTKQIDGFIAQGIKDAHVYINSPGGSVFVANEIINQLKRFTGSLTGTGGALVASAATAIALELDSFEMAENGQYMYHKPTSYLSGNEDKIESDLKLLRDLTKHYKAKYAEKTGKTEEEIEANWAKGDVWLTATEAMNQKFITGVIKKVKITPETKAMFTACGSPVTPEVDAELKPEIYNMKNRDQIIAALKLPSDATDEQIEAAVVAAQKKAETAEKLEGDNRAAMKKQVEDFVDAAIVAKKATADQRDNLIAMGTSNFESLKSFVESIKPVEKPQTTPSGDGGSGESTRANWTLQDYIDNDPQALETLAEKEPAKFKALNEAHYQTKL